MRKTTVIDLALRSWMALITSWALVVLGVVSVGLGVASMLGMVSQASPARGLIGLVGGGVFLGLAVYSFFRPYRYLAILSRLVVLVWWGYAVWHLGMFQGGYVVYRQVFFGIFSAVTFLLLGLWEGVGWHVGWFVLQGVMSFLGMHRVTPGEVVFQGVMGGLFGVFAWIQRESRFLVVQRLYFHPVTNLPNRNYLMDFLGQEPVAWLMILNISNFKEFNDLFGYRIGDRILSEVALRLQSIVENYRSLLVVHLHSDEFAIVGREKWDKGLMDGLCEQIYLALVEKPLVLPSLPSIRLTFHAGVSDQPKNLLGTADMAFRYAVNQGSFFAFYDDRMYVAKAYEQNIQATLLLQDALENNRIVPFFQPIVNLETGKIEKYECLARIVDRNGRTYEPKFFLFIAQRNQLYGMITSTMVKKCFAIFSKMDTDFSLNLSYQDLVDTDTVNLIFAELEAHPDVAMRCIFEIVEEMAIQDFQVVEDFIHRVKEYGVRVALDDFGSGYANLEYLVRLPFDYIKIDGRLIEKLPDDPPISGGGGKYCQFFEKDREPDDSGVCFF